MGDYCICGLKKEKKFFLRKLREIMKCLALKINVHQVPTPLCHWFSATDLKSKNHKQTAQPRENSTVLLIWNTQQELY